jgi:peptidoglycan hydrolase FlgJ
MLTAEQVSRLTTAAAAARVAEAVTGCPAELTCAQWALESSWGSRQLGLNCFGIKYTPDAYGIQFLDTWEVEGGVRVRRRLAFATFPNLAACFEKHGELIANGLPYRPAWDRYEVDHDLDALIVGIAAKYATDPGYAGKLREILAMPQVRAALAA